MLFDTFPATSLEKSLEGNNPCTGPCFPSLLFALATWRDLCPPRNSQLSLFSVPIGRKEGVSDWRRHHERQIRINFTPIPPRLPFFTANALVGRKSFSFRDNPFGSSQQRPKVRPGPNHCQVFRCTAFFLIPGVSSPRGQLTGPGDSRASNSLPKRSWDFSQSSQVPARHRTRAKWPRVRRAIACVASSYLLSPHEN